MWLGVDLEYLWPLRLANPGTIAPLCSITVRMESNARSQSSMILLLLGTPSDGKCPSTNRLIPLEISLGVVFENFLSSLIDIENLAHNENHVLFLHHYLRSYLTAWILVSYQQNDFQIVYWHCNRALVPTILPYNCDHQLCFYSFNHVFALLSLDSEHHGKNTNCPHALYRSLHGPTHASCT